MENRTENMRVLLNPLDICKAETDGKTIKLEISIVPTILIPNTIVTLIRTESR